MSQPRPAVNCFTFAENTPSFTRMERVEPQLAAARASFFSLRPVPIARAPKSWHSCSAAVPTPLATAWISTSLCTVMPACSTSASNAVAKASGSAAASANDRPCGHRDRLALVRHQLLGPRAAADEPHHPIASFQRRTRAPTAATVPAYSSPGMSAGAPGGAG